MLPSTLFSSSILAISIFVILSFTNVTAFILQQRHSTQLSSSSSSPSEFSFSSLTTTSLDKQVTSLIGTNNNIYNYYQHSGFRGVPFFRFGLPSCPSASSNGEETYFPCAILDVNLLFQNLHLMQSKRRIKNFAQLVVYRAEDFENESNNFSSSTTANQNHICGERGQLYGAAVPQSKRELSSSSDKNNKFFVVVDSMDIRGESDDDEEESSTTATSASTITRISSKIPIEQEGLYIVYINSCSYDDDDVSDDVDDKNSGNEATTAATKKAMRMWSNESKIINIGSPSNSIQNGLFSFPEEPVAEINSKNNFSYISLYHLDSSSTSTPTTRVSFLPPQIATLVPAYIAFTSIDVAMLVALSTAMAVVGRARILKYQAALASALLCDVAASAAVLVALRAYAEHPQYSTIGGLTASSWLVATDDGLLLSTIFASARDAILRTFAVFLFFGVGMTRSRFPPRVSGFILVTNVIYVCVKSYVNRNRLQQELSLRFQVQASSSSSSSSAAEFDLPIEKIIVCIALDVVLAMVLFGYAARRTCFGTSTSAASVPTSVATQTVTMVSAQKQSIFSRSVAVVTFYSLCSLVWLVVELRLFYYETNANTSVGSALSVAEQNWRLWPLIEIVPKAILQCFMIVLLFVWFPSKDSQFYVTIFIPSSDDDDDEDNNNEEEKHNNKNPSPNDAIENSKSGNDNDDTSSNNNNNEQQHRSNSKMIATVLPPTSSGASMRRRNLILPQSANEEQHPENDDGDDDDLVLLDAGAMSRNIINTFHDSISYDDEFKKKKNKRAEV